MSSTCQDGDIQRITRAAKDTWAIDFTPALEEGETVTDGAATLRRTNPVTLDLVPGFIVDVADAGTSVDVTWDGSYLRRGESYELEVVGIVSGSVTVPMTIYVEVTG